MFGWLAILGKTRCCGARVPRWYVLSEACAAVAGSVAGAVYALPGIAVVVTFGLAATFVVAYFRYRASADVASE